MHEFSPRLVFRHTTISSRFAFCRIKPVKGIHVDDFGEQQTIERDSANCPQSDNITTNVLRKFMHEFSSRLAFWHTTISSRFTFCRIGDIHVDALSVCQ